MIDLTACCIAAWVSADWSCQNEYMLLLMHLWNEIASNKKPMKIDMMSALMMPSGGCFGSDYLRTEKPRVFIVLVCSIFFLQRSMIYSVLLVSKSIGATWLIWDIGTSWMIAREVASCLLSRKILIACYSLCHFIAIKWCRWSEASISDFPNQQSASTPWTGLRKTSSFVNLLNKCNADDWYN